MHDGLVVLKAQIDETTVVPFMVVHSERNVGVLEGACHSYENTALVSNRLPDAAPLRKVPSPCFVSGRCSLSYV
jgi:hypothetical protein